MERPNLMRIGHLSTFYHTAILLLAQGNANERLGAEIEWKLMGTGPAIMKAFRVGELDLAYIGLPPAIIGMSQGTNVVCVAGGHMEGTVMAGKEKWIAFSDTNDIGKVLSQFRGMKIGVPGKGSIHDVILKDCLDRYGLSGDIEIRNYPWADLVLDAIASDEVSAAFGTPALAVSIKRYAGGKVLIPPSQLWRDNPSYGIVVSNDYLKQEPKRVERFLAMHEEAAEFIRTRPSDAAQLISAFVGIVDKDFVLETLNLSPKYCAKLTKEYIDSTMKFLPVMRKLGYLKEEITQERIFSTDLIDRVHPGKGHYRDASGKEVK